MANHSAKFDGDIPIHNGETFKGTDAVGKLCRKLQTGTLEIFRYGRLAMTVDVEKRKEQSLTENAEHGFRMRKYKPFDVTRLNAECDETKKVGQHT